MDWLVLTMTFALVLVAPFLLTMIAAVALRRTTRLRDKPSLPGPTAAGVALTAAVTPLLARVPVALVTGQPLVAAWLHDTATWPYLFAPAALVTLVAWLYGRAAPRVAVSTAVGALAPLTVALAAGPLLEGTHEGVLAGFFLAVAAYLVTLVTAPFAFLASVVWPSRG